MPELDETPSDDTPRDRKIPTTSAREGVADSRCKRWRRPLLEAFGVLAVFVALRMFQTRSLVSGGAPAIHAVALDGRPTPLGAAAGKAQLLWFFATWCPVCQASEHNVRALGNREDLVLIASDSGSSAALERWLRAQGLERMRVVNDSDGAIARRFGVRSFPTTVAVSAAGQVRSTDVGYSTELGLRWRLFRASH